MIPDPDGRRWRKARRSSGQGGECVEVTTGAVRDSKNPGLEVAVTLSALTGAAKAGLLDR